MAKYTTVYDKNKDYQAMIDDAVANEDYESAAVYEAQRNAKISGEGIKDYAPTYNWQDYLPGAGQKKQTSGYEKYTQQAADFDNAIAEVLGRIGSRQPFSYDAESDPMYQIYKEQYTRNGQKAMQDTLAQVSARTGGLASSFAEQAAQGTFNDYMDRLNGEIPELRSLAYDMYNQELGNDMDYLKLLTAQQQAARENALQERQWQYQMDEDVQKQARAEIDSILSNGGAAESIPQALLDAAGYSQAYLAAMENSYANQLAGRGYGGSRKTAQEEEDTGNEAVDSARRAVRTYLANGGTVAGIPDKLLRDSGYNKRELVSFADTAGDAGSGNPMLRQSVTSLDYDQDEGIFTWNGNRYGSYEALQNAVNSSILSQAEVDELRRKLLRYGFDTED